MPRLLCFLFTLLITNPIFAQTSNQLVVSENFKKSYNTAAYQDIFEAFSPEMKQALPLDKARQFLTDLKNKAGAIGTMEFINQDGAYAFYKTKFEKVVMGVNISIDNQNKINGFFIKPFKESENNKKEAVNLLGNYPKRIGDLIFSATKDLPNRSQLSVAIVKEGKTNFYGIQMIRKSV